MLFCSTELNLPGRVIHLGGRLGGMGEVVLSSLGEGRSFQMLPGTERFFCLFVVAVVFSIAA